MKPLHALAVLLLAALPACLAQQPHAAAGSKPFVIDAGGLELAALIDRCGTHLQWNILSNESELQQAMGGTVFKFQHRIEADTAGCQDLFTNLLYQKGFALLSVDADKQIHEVVFMSGPRAREVAQRAPTVTPEQVLERPNLKTPVLTVVKLQHINSNVATNSLRPFFAQAGGASGVGLTFGTAGSNSSILLQGFQNQVAAAIRMLQVVDVPPAKELDSDLAEQVQALTERVRALEQALQKK